MTDLVAPITEVTVYADRALITRVGSSHLSAGEHELRVNDLPDFLRESLRASGRGPQGTRILNVDLTTTFHSRPPESEIQTLQTACDLLQRQIDLLQTRQTALNERGQWLRSLGEQAHDFAKGLAQGQMKPQDCADFFSFAANQALQNAEAAQDLEVQLKQRYEELGAKQRELAQKQGYGRPDRSAAVVVIEMPTEGEFSLELSYLVTRASWRPQYDVRVVMDADGNQGEVELTYIGVVQQSTGENWEQVNLALSTARPSLAAVLPELKPHYLHVYTPPPQAAAPMVASGATPRGMMKRQAAGMSTDMIVAAAYSNAEETPAFGAQAEVATATVEQTGTAYVFRIARSVDIPSDNSPHKTTIARDNLPCACDYVSAPVIEPNVHLRAKITNTTERVLLPGESSIFLSGEYVGTTKVKLTAPGEQFKIFLGIDDTIKVKREQLERSVEKGALLQTQRAHQVRTTHLAFPTGRYRRIQDRIPFYGRAPTGYAGEGIAIEKRDGAASPPPTKSGMIAWRTFPTPDAHKGRLGWDGEGSPRTMFRFCTTH